MKSAEERFWESVGVSDVSCWLWNKSLNSAGYGRISVAGVRVRAHRFSWELHVGPVPRGLFVCHKCDVPACVRPDHLFLGTNKDNMDDMIAKGRDFHPKGLPSVVAKLTPEQVVEVRKRYRRYDRENSSYVLAHLYGVDRSSINNAVRKRTYQNVKEE